MSIEENKRVVFRWTEDVWNGGRLDLVPELVSDQCVRHDPGKPPVVMSVAANLERITGARAAMPDIHFEMLNVAAEGDLVSGVWTLTASRAGKPVVMSGIEVFRVVGGKIVETWNPPAGDGGWS